jgi:hypothetical protein
MKILLQNGATKTIDNFDIRGLRIKEITLDTSAVKQLLNMHTDDIVQLLLLMDLCMFEPPKIHRMKGMPIDVDNFKLMQAGKNYLMES